MSSQDKRILDMKSPPENTPGKLYIGPQYYQWGKCLFTITLDGETRWVNTGYQVAVDLDVNTKQRSQKQTLFAEFW